MSVYLRSMIWSTVVLAATNSEPYVAVSTVPRHFESHPPGVELMKWTTAITDFPVVRS